MRNIGVIWAAAPLALTLAGCGGGGGGGGTSTAAAPVAATPAPAPVALAEGDAARLAKQATFGATPALVARIVSLGVNGWLDEQFSATGSSYADLAGAPVPRDYCGATGTATYAACRARNFSAQPVAMRFYADAVNGSDQLRQRVALALNELLVASDVEVQSTAGLAGLNQIFLTNAFGNYRDILKAVTLDGYMGDYLDMADSNATAPSENYARELLQLFSIGPNALAMDGSLMRDAGGAPIPNYTPDDVHAVARALTGWTYARLNNAAQTDGNARNDSVAMVPRSTGFDVKDKSFLGVTVAGATSQADTLDKVIDAAFNNASTAPFVARYMIRNLVTANPSPAYVGRVAAVFANNGNGVRGDMKAVVRAILTDAEARGTTATGDGKVKEPVLLMTALARLVGMTTDGYAFTARDAALGQQMFRAPSVFNFYPPDYPLPQSTALVSPASKLMTTGYIVQRHNLVWQWTIEGDQARSEFAVQASIDGATGTKPTWGDWDPLAGDPDRIIDRIDQVVLNRTITAAQKDALRRAILAVTNADAGVQARKRAQIALYIAASAPQFQVDR